MSHQIPTMDAGRQTDFAVQPQHSRSIKHAPRNLVLNRVDIHIRAGKFSQDYFQICCPNQLPFVFLFLALDRSSCGCCWSNYRRSPKSTSDHCTGLLVLRLLQSPNYGLDCCSRTCVVSPGSSSPSLYLGFAADKTGTFSMLGDFNILHHLPQWHAIACGIFTNVLHILGTLNHHFRKDIGPKSWSAALLSLYALQACCLLCNC